MDETPKRATRLIQDLKRARDVAAEVGDVAEEIKVVLHVVSLSRSTIASQKQRGSRR